MGFTPEAIAKGQAALKAMGYRGGMRGTHGKKRLQRLAAQREQVIRLREEGKTLEEIRIAIGKKDTRLVKEILFSGAIRAERLQRLNESLLSLGPKAHRVIEKKLEEDDEDVAMWLMEKIGVVSKEQVSVIINAQNAVIPINQDMLEAARLVASQLEGPVPKRLQEHRATKKEENSNGNTSSGNNVVDGEVTAVEVQGGGS